MRNFLITLALLAFTATTAMAAHLGVPEVGQQRNERIWICKDVEHAKIWYTSSIEFKKRGATPKMWGEFLSDFAPRNACAYATLPYEVLEMIETVSAPIENAEGDAWSGDIPQYLIKTKSPISGEFYYIVTF